MKYLFFIFLFIVFVSMDSLKVENYLDVALHRANQIGEKLASENKLYVQAIGYGNRDFIEKLSVRFCSTKLLTVKETRILYTKILTEFLQEINKDKKLRPYLSVFPMDPNEKVTISFSHSRSPAFKSEEKYVAYVNLINGRINYSYFDFNKNKLKDLHSETYQEAYDIVYNQK